MITVSAPARLHFGLFDLAHATLNRYGGVGLAVAEPRTTVEAVPSKQSVVHNSKLDQFDYDLLSRALALLKDKYGISASVDIKSHPPSHVGLGTTTTTILACILAASQCNGITLDQREIAVLSGRGGTSGIGVNSFFEGGLIIDGGRTDSGQEPYNPSAARALSNESCPPEVMYRVDFPEHWMIRLFSEDTYRTFGDAEIAFFQSNSPIAKEDAYKAIALAYQSMIPAIKAHDINAFKDALDEFQATGFKHREILHQTDSCRNLLARLGQVQGCASGMSSLGPTLFAIYEESNTEVAATLASLGQDLPFTKTCRPDNRGVMLE